jgi:hypothetical protein
MAAIDVVRIPATLHRRGRAGSHTRQLDAGWSARGKRLQRVYGVVWGFQIFACPGCDLFFLAKQDDLRVRSDLQKKVEDVTRPGMVGVPGYVVEDKRARIVIPGQVVGERDPQQQVDLLCGAV